MGGCCEGVGGEAYCAGKEVRRVFAGLDRSWVVEKRFKKRFKNGLRYWIKSPGCEALGEESAVSVMSK